MFDAAPRSLRSWASMRPAALRSAVSTELYSPRRADTRDRPRRTDYYDLGRYYTAQAPNAASVRAPYAFSMWSRPLPFPRFGFALPSPIVLSDRTVKPAGPPCDVQ